MEQPHHPDLPPAAGESWRQSLFAVALPFVASRGLIALVGYASTLVVEKGQYFRDQQGLLRLFFNWDAGWYGAIVREGYAFHADKVSNVAFFPLYPLLVKLVGTIMPWMIAGYVVSNVAFLVAALVLRRLVLVDRDDRRRADRVVWFLMVSPVSFFFSVFYTEGLFLCLTVLMFYHARRRRWWLAALFVMLAGATRSLGVLLAIPLLVEYLAARGGDWRGAWRRVRWDICWLALAPLGLLAYMAYLQWAFGDPLAFSHASAFWNRRFVAVTATLGRLGAYEPFYRAWFVGSLVCTAGLLAAAALTRARASYVVYGLLFLFFNLSSNLLESTPRYFAVLFPLYLGLAAITHGREAWRHTALVASTMMLTLTTVLYVNGYWLT